MASVDGLGIPGITEPVRVGQGGFGTVYRASQPAYRRTVAVKVMSGPMLDDEGQRAFERECQALGSLSSHPNIVSLYAAGISDFERPYLIMDYLPGGSLGDRIVGHPLGWQEAIEIGIKISGALATAHAAGVLHRDVKPENILLSAYGEPQLADFGVARLQGGTRTATGTITGSLAHAAPEVLSGVSATEASDVWSLASTVATLILGHPPFHRDGETSLHPLITRILTGSPADLRPLGVPDVACEAIEAALVKDSWERTPTAIAFGESLQAVQQALGLPVTTLPAPTDLLTQAGLLAPALPPEVSPPEVSPPGVSPSEGSPSEGSPPGVSSVGVAPSTPAPVVPSAAAAASGAGALPPSTAGGVAGTPPVPGAGEATRYRFVRPDAPAESNPEVATRRRGPMPDLSPAGVAPTPPDPVTDPIVTRYGPALPHTVAPPESGSDDLTRRRVSVDSIAAAPAPPGPLPPPVPPPAEAAAPVIPPSPVQPPPPEVAAPVFPPSPVEAPPPEMAVPEAAALVIPPSAVEAAPPEVRVAGVRPSSVQTPPGPSRTFGSDRVEKVSGSPPAGAASAIAPPTGRESIWRRAGSRRPIAMLVGAAAVIVIVVAVVVATGGGGKGQAVPPRTGPTVPTTIAGAAVTAATSPSPATTSATPATTVPPPRTTLVTTASTPAPTPAPTSAPAPTTAFTSPPTAPPRTTPATTPTTTPQTVPQETTTVCEVKNGKRICFVP